MSNLLRANLARLFKSRLFRFSVILLVGYGIFFTLKRYFDIRYQPELFADLPEKYKCAEGYVFSAVLHIMFVAAIVIGSFLGTDYSDGTIRNKVIAGYGKGKMYLADFITCTIISLALMFTEMLVVLGIGHLVFDETIMSAGKVVLYFLCECLSMIALTAVLILPAMLISNKASSMVLTLLLAALILGAALHIEDGLQQPEYKTGYVMTEFDQETNTPLLEPETTKNPYFLTGTKRMVYEFLYDFVPACQFLQVMSENFDNIPIMAGYSLLLSAVAVTGGMFLFLKKDLR